MFIDDHLQYLQSQFARPPRTLSSYFSQSTLTTDQANAAEAIERFIQNPQSGAFILKGAAGTGKTFLMKALVQYLADRNCCMFLMAPTGKAAEVLTNATGYKARTVHRSIFTFEDEEGNGGKDIIIKELRIAPNNSFIVCDEASMLSETISERTNKEVLLESLMIFSNLGKSKNKLILIGDAFQLPPIHQEESLALQSLHFKNKYQAACTVIELNDVVRQKTHSGILFLANTFRHALVTKQSISPASLYRSFIINHQFGDVDRVRNSISSIYLSYNSNSWDDNAIIIAHTNKTVDRYNKAVRAHYFSSELIHQPCVGDKLLVTKNSYTKEHDVYNGDIGFISARYADVEVLSISVHQGGVNKTVDLLFYDVEIQLKPNQGIERRFRTHICGNALFSGEPGLNEEERLAFYILRNIRTQHCTSQLEREEVLRNDPHLNALIVKFGYAITCHKSQGSSWQAVILDNKSAYDNLRWHYTAITRAEERLYLIS